MKITNLKKTRVLEVSLACIVLTYLILNPSHANISGMSSKVDELNANLLPILKAVSACGMIGGCILWSIGNENGKEWGKKSAVACVVGFSAISLIGGLTKIFAA